MEFLQIFTKTMEMERPFFLLVVTPEKSQVGELFWKASQLQKSAQTALKNDQPSQNDLCGIPNQIVTHGIDNAATSITGIGVFRQQKGLDVPKDV